MATKSYKALTVSQIKAMESQGCRAESWSKVQVADGFDATRVRNTEFAGEVKIGSLSGKVKIGGVEKVCGIYDATISNCTIGDGCRIANVILHIMNYDIGNGVCIEYVLTMQTNPGATFGNGVEVDVLNEAGGREVVLFDELTSQFAYMLCLHRYRPKLIESLKAIAKKYTESVRSDRGKIGEGTIISLAKQILDVNIGSYAKIIGASSLVNGTILSTKDAPTVIGNDVAAHDFIIAESSSVTGGAILGKVFVGQGCQMGKQYSAENSLFFANCEAFHGEACSIFAGPYTVTHHKSSLLIAGLFSFYNAGSGTNQSNHMYKLGPVHEGKIQRGSKTGSFSYMMWPCRVGPFSVVLGKHTSTFDTANYPFSHLDARSDGKCNMVPGLHLTTVGTVRDGDKWPNRDRRKGNIKRDAIAFDVFSPYTVGKMVTASELLKHLQDTTDKAIEEVSVGGAMVRRPILRTGQKYYRTGIEMYILEKVVAKAEEFVKKPSGKISNAFAVDKNAVYSEKWVDIGGLMMPQQRLVDLHNAIEAGKIVTVADFAREIEKIVNEYKIDEWAWAKNTYKKIFEKDLDNATKDDIAVDSEAFLKARSKFLNLVAGDAEKEFDEQSRCGFGEDGSGEDSQNDFAAVRGTYATNKFVKQMKGEVEKLQIRIGDFKEQLKKV